MPKFAKRDQRLAHRFRRLRFEPLEPRLVLTAIQVTEQEPLNNTAQPLSAGDLWEIHGSLGQDDLDYYSVEVGDNDSLQIAIRPDQLTYDASFTATARALINFQVPFASFPGANSPVGGWIDIGEDFDEFTTSHAIPSVESQLLANVPFFSAEFSHSFNLRGGIGEPLPPAWPHPIGFASASMGATYSVDDLVLSATTTSSVNGGYADYLDLTAALQVGDRISDGTSSTFDFTASVNANYSGVETRYDNGLPIGSSLEFEVTNVTPDTGSVPPIATLQSIILDNDVTDLELWRFTPDSIDFTPHVILIDPNDMVYGVINSEVWIADPEPGEWRIAVAN
jgi:hypothetical protein